MNALLNHWTAESRRRRLRAEAEEDAKAIQRCQSGDLQAFEQLVRRYRPIAMRICMGFLRNSEEALDCSQDAFVQALEALPRFDNTKPFFPWFYRVIRNVCLKRLRRLRLLRESPLEVTDERMPHCDDVQRNDLSDAVWEALGRLSPEQREIVILRHWENMSYEAIAASAGLPVGTIMSRLHYARVKLSKLLRGLDKL